MTKTNEQCSEIDWMQSEIQEQEENKNPDLLMWEMGYNVTDEQMKRISDYMNNDRKKTEDELQLFYSFLCGFFDKNMVIRPYQDRAFFTLKYNDKYSEFFEGLKKFMKYSMSSNNKYLIFSDEDAINILGRLYHDKVRKYCYSENYYRFLSLINYDSLSESNFRTNYELNKNFYFQYCKLSPLAIAPKKTRVSDSGYDLHAVGYQQDKNNSNLFMFDTGLAIKPVPGYYFEVYPRSSLFKKHGWILSNSVGVIDSHYRGPIKLPLIKIDKTKPFPELPFKCVQIIPKKIIHLSFEEVDSFDATERNDGGFGSTDNF
jgi:deoxyuridine 5'-triphosphate nucleotidohydrolase